MSKKTVSSVLGAAIVSTFASTASAGDNPFELKNVVSSVQLAEADKTNKEMACGEGKCGGSMLKSMGAGQGTSTDGQKSTDSQQNKAMEGKCAGMKMDSPAGNAAPAAPGASPAKP